MGRYFTVQEVGRYFAVQELGRYFAVQKVGRYFTVQEEGWYLSVQEVVMYFAVQEVTTSIVAATQVADFVTCKLPQFLVIKLIVFTLFVMAGDIFSLKIHDRIFSDKNRWNMFPASQLNTC